MKIGIIGAGAISQFLMKELKQQADMQVTSILVRNEEKYKAIAKLNDVQLFTDIEAFLRADVNIVVEAANIQAVANIVPIALRNKPVVVISVGALADESLLSQLTTLAEQHNHQLYLPSGAIGGLDLLQNAYALGAVSNVTLTTRKPAHSLLDTAIEEAQIIYEGTANEAIKRFPKNMNVSIVLGLASIGFERTKVRLIADPHIEQNIHKIEVVGDFGEATIEVKNNPLPANPKTSYLAAMSIVGTLKRIQSQIIVGG